MKNYDIAIVGSGPAGYVAAIRAGQLGLKTVIFEKADLGGICLNHGCIPSKTLLKTGQVMTDILNSDDFGIDLGGSKPKVDCAKLMARKDKVIGQLQRGVTGLLKANKADVVKGEAVCKSAGQVECGGEVYSCKNLLIATGSTDIRPSIKGLDAAYKSGFAVDTKAALQIDSVPKTVAVYGSGVYATEFACMYSALGAEVTYLLDADSVMPNIDKEIVKQLETGMRRAKIKIVNAEITGVGKNKITYTSKGKPAELAADRLIVSTGRTANMAGLEKLNLKTIKTATGGQAFQTDEYCRSSSAGVYVIGDANGKTMMAHSASAEAIAVVESVHSGNPRKLNYNNIPVCVYSYPEIAVTGLTEDQAKEQGFDIETSKFNIAANGKALTESQGRGMVKLVIDKKYRQVLGVHILAPNATELISEAVLAIDLEATADDLSLAVHPHPTIAEMVMEAGHLASGKKIHG